MAYIYSLPLLARMEHLHTQIHSDSVLNCHAYSDALRIKAAIVLVSSPARRLAVVDDSTSLPRSFPGPRKTKTEDSRHGVTSGTDHHHGAPLRLCGHFRVLASGG